MTLIHQALGVIVILCAIYILKDTIPKIGRYPSWVSRSIIILVVVAILWGLLSIVSTLNFISLSHTYSTLIGTIRTALFGVMIGLCIVIRLAGYIGSGAGRKGSLQHRVNQSGSGQ